MLLAVIAVVVGAGAGWLSGGRLTNVTRVHMHRVGLLMAGAVVELAGGLWGTGHVGLGLVVAGYALLAAFAVANVHLTGMVLVAAGLLANMAVFAVDGGMPVKGVPLGQSLGPRHHPLGPGDRLVGLSDVITIGVFDEKVSAGDIVLCLGAATVVWDLVRPVPPVGGPLARRRRKLAR